MRLHGLRGRWGKLFAGLFLAGANPALAAEHPPREAERGLPGFLRVGLPRSQPHQLAFRVASGYGVIESFSGLDSSTQRLNGDVAIAYSPLARLSLSLDLSGRLDGFPGSQEGANLYGEPRLTARGVVWESEKYAFAVQLDARFVGRAAPDIDFSATSPTLVGLFSFAPAPKSELGLELGFHLDRSALAVDAPERLSAADRVTLGASSSPAVRIGLAGSHSFSKSKTVWLAELRADLLVLDNPPPILTSPITLSVGARQPLSRMFALQANLDLGLSGRPADFTSGQLMPIGPRAGLLLALAFTPEKAEPAKEAPPPPPPPPPPLPPPVLEAEPLLVEATGLVVDEAGQGVPDVEIGVRSGDDELPPVRTGADGSFRIAGLPEHAILSLEARAVGFDAEQRTLNLDEGRELEITIYPSLPRGVVRGTVRDVAGSGLPAQIHVEPGGQVIDVSPDGTFQIELPPGAYRIAFEHPGFGRETRSVTIVESGVIILNIGLAH